MPRVDEMIDRLRKARYISTLDLSRGYCQVPMSAESRKKTAFIIPYGLFEINVMPFGLHGAPATFQWMMDNLLHGLEDSSATYIDDVVVHSVTWADHLSALRAVLTTLKVAGLMAKPGKCHFAMAKCSYLGHVVGNGQVRPDNIKIAAVEVLPTPRTKRKKVRIVLGTHRILQEIYTGLRYGGCSTH